MARRKNPIDKLVHAATDALKDPVGTAGKAVEQAKESVGVGRTVAGQVGRAAVAKATDAAGAVTSRVPRRTSFDAPRAASPRPAKPAGEREPAADKAAPAKNAATKSAKKSTKKAAKKSTKKTAAKKGTKKAAKKTAKKTAKKAPAKKAPRPLTAQQVADVEGGPAVTTPVGTTAADVATNPDTTDTDLQQPGTEPLLDPGAASAVRSESETLRKAAESSAESSAESNDESARGEGEGPAEPEQPSS